MPTWKPIKGFEKRYEISNTGKIRNRETGLLRKYRKDKDGYPVTDLKLPGVHKTVRVHKLVAEHHISKGRKDQVLVNHKDGDKANMSLRNLEWASHSENTKHAYDNGLAGTKNTAMVTQHKRKRKNGVSIVRRHARKIRLRSQGVGFTDPKNENKFRQKAGGLKTPIRTEKGSLHGNKFKPKK